MLKIALRRAISKEFIENALNNPDEILKKNDIKIVHKIIGEKLLRIIYRETDDSIIIISAYITNKERYLGVK